MQRATPIMIAAAIAAMAAPVWADKLPMPSVAYSADITETMQGHAYSGHVNVDGNKERRELANANGAKTIMIIRRDQNRVYDIRPQRNMAIALRMAAAEAAGQTGAPGIDVYAFYGEDATPEGKETIAGQPTTRYRIKLDSGGLTVNATLWMTEDGIIVKSVGKTSVERDSPPASMQLTNIDRKPQDPSLFEVPQGVSVISPDSDPDLPETDKGDEAR